jgi:glycosyltransferase involved in cell wall biosynthesis
MANQVGIDPGQLIRIHYGLEVSSGKPGLREAIRSELGIDPEAPVVGIIARLTPQKNHERLLDAFATVHSKIPLARLLIVGHDPGGLRSSLESFAEQLGLSQAVRFLGYRDDREAILEAIDCFVLPSLWEGFGLVLLEAMTVGRAVVATRVGAIPEIVLDGYTGFLVEPDDHSGLAESMVRVLGDRALADKLGEEGRRRALCEFSPAKMVDATVRIYEQILGIVR